MHRLATYLLGVCFVLLGTGVFKHLHNLCHTQVLPAVADLHQQSPQPARAPLENDRDCPLHLMLAAPLLDQAGSVAIVWDVAGGWAPPVVQGEPANSRQPVRVDCRGPPSC